MYFYIVTIDNMKIFSSFDTNLQQESYEEYVTKYGEDNVLIVKRWSLYFSIKVLTRLFYGILIQLSVLWCIYFLIWYKDINIYVIIISIIFWLPLYIIALSNYIDYKMDYAIFTPDEVIFVEQINIFNREIKSLDVAKIKSITTRKKNLFFSLFDSGLLTIISEWNEKLWEIVLNYVYKLEHVKKKIHEIIIQNERIKNKQTND